MAENVVRVYCRCCKRLVLIAENAIIAITFNSLCESCFLHASIIAPVHCEWKEEDRPSSNPITEGG